ncbi:putative F-box/FBD/LRR-repeat protein [Spatholobus suberectus]|nr:putative F-box/FBD/LRR-repeat protein [Spatholobus suberectus]
MKRRMTSGRDGEEERDRLSDLPDYVLLHVMNFMDTRYAVQTCVLSKRWKDLWKSLTTLSFSYVCFINIASFNKFVSRVVSDRDDSISLLNLRIRTFGSNAPALLNRVLKYAASHNVQHLAVTPHFSFTNIPNFLPLIFSCQSLTSLRLFGGARDPPLGLPKSLPLPALKSLHLSAVRFTASDDDCAEPFSTCSLLNTLVIEGCSLRNDAKVLRISNSNLSSLTLDNSCLNTTPQRKIVLSTPNLTSIAVRNNIISNNMIFSYCQLSSTCNLSLLEQVNIDTTYSLIHYSVIAGWLQVFSNVKTLTLSTHTLNVILKHLNLATMEIQPPPCFVRLESLKMKMRPYKIPNEAVKRIVKYLLQNSPLTRVAVIDCWKSKTYSMVDYLG